MADKINDVDTKNHWPIPLRKIIGRYHYQFRDFNPLLKGKGNHKKEIQTKDGRTSIHDIRTSSS